MERSKSIFCTCQCKCSKCSMHKCEMDTGTVCEVCLLENSCAGLITSKMMAESFQKFRKMKVYCDVTLATTTGTKQFPCHRVILACESEYFQNVFSDEESNNINNNGGDKLIRLTIEERILEKFLNILYGQPTDCGSEALDLLFAAVYFRAKNITNRLQKVIIEENFIVGERKIERLLKLCFLPNITDLPLLFLHARKCVHYFFRRLSREERFFEFSFIMLIRFDVLINVKLFDSPTKWVNFIGKWIYYDLKNRITYIDVILRQFETKSDFKRSTRVMVVDVCDNMEDEELLKNYVKIIVKGLLFEPMQRKFAQAGKAFSFDSTSNVNSSSSLKSTDYDYTMWTRCKRNNKSSKSSEVGSEPNSTQWDLLDKMEILYGHMESEHTSDYSLNFDRNQ